MLVDFRACFTDYVVLEAGQREAERMAILYENANRKRMELEDKLKKRALEERRESPAPNRGSFRSDQDS